MAAGYMAETGEQAWKCFSYRLSSIVWFQGAGKVACDEQEQPHQVPVIYGDYFFTEAILRLMEKDFFIW